MHYYQHHIGDFIKATARLSDSQLVAYLRLLWMYYDQERPLHNDLDVLSMQIGVSVDDTFLLLRAYFKKDGDVWRHTRCDKEIADYHAHIAKKSNAGKASAERRKNNSSTGVQQAFDNSSTAEQLTSNQQPITNNQCISQDKPAKPKRKTSIHDDFSVSKRVADWASQKGFDRLDEHLDAFKRKAKMNAYTYADWDLAFMEAIREDWAKLRGKPSFAQQAADIARTTVPAANKGPDPALVKIEQDRLKAVPPSLEQLEKMAALRRSMTK